MKLNEDVLEEIHTTLYSQGWKYLEKDILDYLSSIKEQLGSLTSTREQDLINKGQKHAIETLMAVFDEYKKK